MKGMMKAAVFKGIEHMEIESLEIPSCPDGGFL